MRYGLYVRHRKQVLYIELRWSRSKRETAFALRASVAHTEAVKSERQTAPITSNDAGKDAKVRSVSESLAIAILTRKFWECGREKCQTARRNLGRFGKTRTVPTTVSSHTAPSQAQITPTLRLSYPSARLPPGRACFRFTERTHIARDIESAQ